MQQRTTQLTVILKVDRYNRVIQPRAAITVNILNLATVPRVVQEKSATGLRHQPVHGSEDVVACGVVGAVWGDHGVVGEDDAVTVGIVVASVAEEFGDVVDVGLAWGVVNGGILWGVKCSRHGMDGWVVRLSCCISDARKIALE